MAARSGRSALALAIGAAVAASLAVAASREAAPPGLAPIEAAILRAVDAHRESQGLQRLTPSPALARIARAHSEAMASGASGFGHDGFDTRRDAAARELSLGRFAENVARTTRPDAEVADAIAATWLASAVHRRNIEGPFRLTGLAAARADDGTTFVTQLFVAELAGAR